MARALRMCRRTGTSACIGKRNIAREYLIAVSIRAFTSNDVPVLLHIRNAAPSVSTNSRPDSLRLCGVPQFSPLSVARMEKVVSSAFQEVRSSRQTGVWNYTSWCAFLDLGHTCFLCPAQQRRRSSISADPHSLELVNPACPAARRHPTCVGKCEWNRLPNLVLDGPRPRITTQSQKLRSMAWLIRSLLNTNEA